MSRRQSKELLPDIKPASQYQEKLKKLQEIREENIINQQLPLITRAFAQLEKDISSPITIQLKQPLNHMIHEELVKKGYNVEEIQQFSEGKKQYATIISIPQYGDRGDHGDHGDHHFLDDFGFFFLPFYNNFQQPLALTDREFSDSNLKIEELHDDDPQPKSIPNKQQSQSTETRVKKTQQVGEPKQIKRQLLTKKLSKNLTFPEEK